MLPQPPLIACLPPPTPDLRIPLMWKDTEYFRNKGGEWGCGG